LRSNAIRAPASSVRPGISALVVANGAAASVVTPSARSAPLLGDGQRPTGLDEHRVEQTRQLVDRIFSSSACATYALRLGARPSRTARRARSATGSGD